jgi:hypothetical protein
VILYLPRPLAHRVRAPEAESHLRMVAQMNQRVGSSMPPQDQHSERARSPCSTAVRAAFTDDPRPARSTSPPDDEPLDTTGRASFCAASRVRMGSATPYPRLLGRAPPTCQIHTQMPAGDQAADDLQAGLPHTISAGGSLEDRACRQSVRQRHRTAPIGEQRHRSSPVSTRSPRNCWPTRTWEFGLADGGSSSPRRPVLAQCFRAPYLALCALTPTPELDPISI